MSFAATVKQVRLKLGISQEQLARELNTSFSTINRWENGKSQPRPMGKSLFYSFCRNNNIDIKTTSKREGDK